MVLLELVTQGVRGFAPNARTAFDPGHAQIAAFPEGAPALSHLLLAALYGDVPEDAGDPASDPTRKPKLALTFQGTDAVTYRIVRELGGTTVLQRLNPSSQRFEVMTQDAEEAARALADLGLPPRQAFDAVCLLQPSQLPSRRAQKGRGSQKLRALVKELDLAREVESLQAKQDQLVAEMYPLEAQLRSADGVRAALEEAERAWASAPTAEELGVAPDIAERLSRYAEVAQRRAAALEKLARDREAIGGADGGAAMPLALHRDPRFLGAAGLGAAFLVGAAFLEGTLRYLALLDVPAFGAAALFALQWVDGVREASRGGRARAGELLASREKRIEDEFEAASAPVRAALTALSVESPDEALKALGQKALLAERAEELRRQLAEAEGDPALSAAMRQHAALKAKADAVAARLEARASGYVRHSRDVEAELMDVRAAEATAASRRAPAPLEDPAPELLRALCDWSQAGLPEVAQAVAERTGRYLSALTGKRFTAVEFDAKGLASVSGEGGMARATELSPEDADLLYLSLRLAAAEGWAAEVRAPVVAEGAGGMTAGDKQPLLSRMLKHLGASTQVLAA